MSVAGRGADPAAASRFQPLLLAGTVLGYLPYGLGTVTDPRDRWVLLAGATVLFAGSVGAWWWHRSRATRRRHRELVALGLGLLTVIALVAMLGWADQDGVIHLLAYVLLLSSAFALTPVLWMRLAVQGTVLLAVGARLTLLGWSPARVAVVVVLLATTTGLVNVFATDLDRARRSQRRARTAADGRARLLDTVARLPRYDEPVGREHTTETLRALGLGEVSIHRTANAAAPAGVDGSVAADAHAPDVAGVEGSAAAVRVPIQVAGQVRGRIEVDPGPGRDLTDPQRELLVTLAAQVGRNWEIEEQHQRQGLRLRRMTDLEHTRRSFLDAVTEELRAPLADVHEAAATLRTPVDPARREAAAATLLAAADDLRAAIDALFDVSRLHLVDRSTGGGAVAVETDQRAPQAGDEQVATPLSELLAVMQERCGRLEVAVADDPELLVAPGPLRHALELWLAAAAPPASCWLAVCDDPAGVRLERRWSASDHAEQHGGHGPLVTRLVLAAGGIWRSGDELVLPLADREVAT